MEEEVLVVVVKEVVLRRGVKGFSATYAVHRDDIKVTVAINRVEARRSGSGLVSEEEVGALETLEPANQDELLGAAAEEEEALGEPAVGCEEGDWRHELLTIMLVENQNRSLTTRSRPDWEVTTTVSNLENFPPMSSSSDDGLA